MQGGGKQPAIEVAESIESRIEPVMEAFVRTIRVREPRPSLPSLLPVPRRACSLASCLRNSKTDDRSRSACARCRRTPASATPPPWRAAIRIFRRGLAGSNNRDENATDRQQRDQVSAPHARRAFQHRAVEFVAFLQHYWVQPDCHRRVVDAESRRRGAQNSPCYHCVDGFAERDSIAIEVRIDSGMETASPARVDRHDPSNSRPIAAFTSPAAMAFLAKHTRLPHEHRLVEQQVDQMPGGAAFWMAGNAAFTRFTDEWMQRRRRS